MKPSVPLRSIFLTLLFWILGVALAAQQPPAPPPAPEPAAADKPTPAAPEKPAAENAATPDSAAATAPAGTAPEPAAEPSAPAEKPPLRSIEVGVESDEKGTRPRIRRNGSGDFPMGDHVVPKGTRVHEAVSIFGSTTVEGEVATDTVSIMGQTNIGPEATIGGAAVAVLGRLNSSGNIKQDAVSVLGGAIINGHVGGDAVCVLGDLKLGPNAVIDGDTVCVLGKVTRHADTVVHGNLVNVPLFGGWKEVDWLTTWVKRCVFLGRPLAFGQNLAWAWGVAFAFLAFYLVLSLLFGRAMDRCVETFETRPGTSILTSVLTVLITPVAIILLAVTVVGALLIPFVGVGLLFAGLFGKAVMLAWIGRRVVKLGHAGERVHPFFAVLVGGLIVMLLYTVWGSFLLYKLLSWLGLGVTVYTVILAMKREKPAVAVTGPAGGPPPVPPSAPLEATAAMSSAAPAVATAPTASAGFVGYTAPDVPPPPAPPAMPVEPALGAMPEQLPPVPPPAPPGPPSAPGPLPFTATAPMSPPPAPRATGVPGATPVIISAATLPRAGFGIRLAAMLLDLLLVGMVLGVTSHALPRMLRFDPVPQMLLLFVALYGAAMWKHKGTTIGGVVCGLKVVRMDHREIDWATAIVRAASCFLSLAAAGLGFIWVAFDDEKQSWHDKIAGTTVVRVPKGVSLL